MWTIGIATLSTVVAVARPPFFGPRVFIAPAPVVVAPAPVVVVPTPSVTVDVEVGVPDTYVWDGYEYIGFIGPDCFYLGPGDVWITCDPGRLERFHAWERVHADWREHASRNMKYRNDAHGHAVPLRSDTHDNRDNHEGDKSHHDRDHEH